MFTKKEFEFELSGSKFTLQSGIMANNANASILATYGETSVLLVISIGSANSDLDFVPLSVEYSEKLYSSGRISSSPYVKRESRPTDHQILSGRLIDHAIRSLFPSGIRNEIQLICQVLSYDKEHDPVLTSLVGASFALKYSGLPIKHVYGATKIGFINDKLVLNPKLSELKESHLSMFVSSTSEGIVSIEAESEGIKSDDLKKAIQEALEQNKILISLHDQFTKSFGTIQCEEILVVSENHLDDLVSEIESAFGDKIDSAIYLKEKRNREKALANIYKEVQEIYEVKIESGVLTLSTVNQAIEKIIKKIVRKNVLKNSKRPDGRKIDEVRPIDVQIGVLPRVHGSALFTRGETQTLSVVTLGTERDALNLEGLNGDYTKDFFHHYNMPGYANGEVDRKFNFANRRAIGHGNIGENALRAVIKRSDSFPYTIRLVSEVMSSNGSTSMSSTCSGMMALMDAGVPTSDIVGGIGVGLVYEDEKNYVVLTDIIGFEDFYGDMDFKICGTKERITAIQLDNKMAGIPVDVLFDAIDRSNKARSHVIEKMEACLPESRVDVSHFAPKIRTVKVHPDKVRLVIGPGGKNIKSIVEKTGVDINISEDNSGNISIYSSSNEAFEKAIELISIYSESLTSSMVYSAKIIRVNPSYGLIVQIEDSNLSGMVHISKLGIKNEQGALEKAYKIGDKVSITGAEKDAEGRYRFSLAK